MIDINQWPILSILIWLPLAAALLLLILPRSLATDRNCRWLTLGVMSLDLALAAALVLAFNGHSHVLQFAETRPWIPSLNAHYRLGIDGISVLFVLLTALVGWISVLASWRAIVDRVRQFMSCLLIMQSLMLGVFCARDLLLFYLFWEAMLIPMYLLIGIWGGNNRFYATLKFFLYTLAGSVLFLIGVIGLYVFAGQTFDMDMLGQHPLPRDLQIGLFIALFFGFAIKVPMFPFHTWLPDAHVEAPTAGSIILAGILLKMGAYGFIRFSLPILPLASQYFAPLMALLSVIAIIYGGLLALAQQDLKKLVAYSSISHMGFVTLGLFMFNSQGIAGALLQMFNHGIVTSALFLMVGLLYERVHSRDMDHFGGLMKIAPLYTLCYAVFVLASMALPGTSSFVGELLVLAGAFASQPVLAAFAIAGAGLSALYLLAMYRRIALGPLNTERLANISDINARELVAVLSLMLFVFWIGFHPLPFITLMQASIDHLLDKLVLQIALLPATGS